MKNAIICVSGLIVGTAMILISCDDVPVSNNRLLPDDRLIGYWQVAKGEAYLVERNHDGVCQTRQYEIDEQTGAIRNIHDPENLFFATIKDKTGSLNFLSIGSGGVFNTIKYHFNSDNELILTPLSYDFVKKYFADVDGITKYGTSETLNQFIKSNMRLTSLYDQPTKLVKKKMIKLEKRNSSSPVAINKDRKCFNSIVNM